MFAFEEVTVYPMLWVVLGVWTAFLALMVFSWRKSQWEPESEEFDKVEVEEDGEVTTYDLSELSPEETEGFLDNWEGQLTE